MKKILNTTIALIGLLLPLNSYSQTNSQNTTSTQQAITALESGVDIKEAYTSFEPQVLADIDWLNNNPVNENKNMRDEKARFVLMWMSGSPTINIRMDDRLITFLGADPAILMAYMMGWTKYALNNNYSTDAVQCTVAGITNAVQFYSANGKYFRKDKELDRYQKMVQDGTLTRYVADILTK